MDILKTDLGGKGNLTIGIYCIDCNAQFELDNSSLVLAIAMDVTFAEYVRYVQNYKCPKCCQKVEEKE